MKSRREFLAATALLPGVPLASIDYAGNHSAVKVCWNSNETGTNS